MASASTQAIAVSLSESAREPLYEAAPLEVRVARSLSDLVQVIAVRSLVYMGEQDCPFAEEFDDNDFVATHLLAHIGDEPMGTLRLRWFAGFVKLERVAVRRHARGGAVVTALCREAAELASRKGYQRILGHIQVRLAPFWVRHGGARLRPGRPRFRFSDHDYVEVERVLPPHERALTIDAEPLVLLRPEGAWDVPGILDASATRPASGPCR